MGIDLDVTVEGMRKGMGERNPLEKRFPDVNSIDRPKQ